MSYLEKWFLGDLFLPFPFLVKVTKMQLLRFIPILGREEVIWARKTEAFLLSSFSLPHFCY